VLLHQLVAVSWRLKFYIYEYHVYPMFQERDSAVYRVEAQTITLGCPKSDHSTRASYNKLYTYNNAVGWYLGERVYRVYFVVMIDGL
jgi:hypothetical protein